MCVRACVRVCVCVCVCVPLAASIEPASQTKGLNNFGSYRSIKETLLLLKCDVPEMSGTWPLVRGGGGVIFIRVGLWPNLSTL